MKSEAAAQRLAPLFVVVAAIAIYLNAFYNGFAYDDGAIIVENTRVHDLAAWRNIWLKPYWPSYGVELGLYRPFAIFLYAVQWAIGGGAPWIFHAVSLLLHGLATLLVFLVLDRLTARVPAFAGALVFAVHPLHVESVANVVGQAELVTAIAFFGACLVHITRPPGADVSWPRRFALIGLYALGLLTKENAVVLPGLLLVFDIAQRRMEFNLRGMALYLDRMFMPLFLLGATLLFYLTLRFEVLSGALFGVDVGPNVPFLRGPARVLNGLRVFPEYARLLFFPKDLANDYAPGVLLPVESVTGMVVLGAFLLLGLVVLALATPWSPAAGLAAAWFLITIITVSNLLFPIGIMLAERTLYAPSMAVSLVIAFGWLNVLPRASRATRRLAPALLVIVAVLLGARTWARTPVWKSSEHLLMALGREHPEAYRAQWFQGAALAIQGDLAGAEERYYYAYRLYPYDPQVLTEYGMVLRERGRPSEAVKVVERSYQMTPYVVRTVMTLAHVYLLDGQYDRGLEMARRAYVMGLDPGQAMALHAWAYHGLQRHDRAVGAWRIAAAHSSFRRWVYEAFLARALVIAGHDDEARATLARGRSVAEGPIGRRKIDELAAAIHNGCYDHLRPGPAGAAPFVVPPCDPLGDFIALIADPKKNATLLHNASASQLDPAVAAPRLAAKDEQTQ